VEVGADRGGACAEPRVLIPVPTRVGETELFTAPVTLTGFDPTASYLVFVSVPETVASLDLGTKDGLSAAFGFDGTTLRRGVFELGFSGTYAQIAAALASLEVTRLKTIPAGIELTVSVREIATIPLGATTFFFPENGHYYEFVNTGSAISWTAARDAAARRSLFGMTGYLVTITSAAESFFVSSQITAPNIWIGASDDSFTVGPILGAPVRSITRIGRSGTTVTVSAPAHGRRAGDRVVLSGLTGSWTALNGEYAVATVATTNTFTVTSGTSGTITAGDGGGAGRVRQSFEGRWHWVTGPEAGQEFWSATDLTKQWKGTRLVDTFSVAGTGARVSGRYEAWRNGEPNNANGSEHFAAANFNCGGPCNTSENWNDFSLNNAAVQSYLVEYGGLPGEAVMTLGAQGTRTFAAIAPVRDPDVFVYDQSKPLPVDENGDPVEPGVRGEDWDVIDGKLVVYTDPVFIPHDEFQAAIDDPTNPLTDIEAGTFSGDGPIDIPDDQTLRIDTSEDSTYSGDISGGGGIIKDGDGGLTLDGENTYEGGTTIADGDLIAGSDDAFGTGPINILPGGNLDPADFDIENDVRTNITDADVFVYDATKPLPLDENGDPVTPSVRPGDWDVIDGKLIVYTDPVYIPHDEFQRAIDEDGLTEIESGTFSGDGPIVIPDGRTLIIDTSEDGSEYYGSISGEGGIEKRGEGDLTLYGPNTYEGGTTISEGELIAGLKEVVQDPDVIVFDRDNPANDDVEPSVRGRDWDVIDGELVVYRSPVFIPDDEFQRALDDPTNPLTDIDAGTFSGDGSFDIPDGQVLTIETSEESTFSGDIGGGGTLLVDGDGDLTLTGDIDAKQAIADADVTIVPDGTTPKSIRGTDWDVIDGQLIIYTNPANITREDLQAAIDDPTNPLTDIDVGTFNGNQPIVIPDGQLLTIETSEDSTYSGDISGEGTLLVTGDGDLNLTGDIDAKQAIADADVTIVPDGTTPKSERGTDWDVIDGQLIIYTSPANITREDLQAAIDDEDNPLTRIDVGTFEGDEPIDVPGGQSLIIETSDPDGDPYTGDFSGGGTVVPRGETEIDPGSPFGPGGIVVGPDAELIVPEGIVIDNPVKEAIADADITVVEGGGSPRGEGWDVIDGRLVVYTTPISINGAALQAAIDDPTNPLLIIEANTFSGDQPLEIPDGQTLTIDTAGDSTYSGDISGGGGIVKQGEGDLTLSGDNSYSGGTVIAEGELTAGSDTAFGTGPIIVAPDADLDVAGFEITNPVREPIEDADVTIVDRGGSPRGEGWDVIDGRLVVYINPIEINRGALQAAIDDPLNPLLIIEVGTFNGDQPLRLHPDRSLTIDTSQDGSVYSGAISGGGPLVKEGTGDLTLSGDNTFSGGVIVNGGELIAGRDSSPDGLRGPFGSGTVTVGPDATLDLAGRTVRNPVTVIRRPQPGQTFSFSLSLSTNLTIGRRAELVIEGGPADFDIVWQASYNPVFATGVARFDADGRATISFVVPRVALGRPVFLELVAWTAPMEVGIAVDADGRVRPARINAGGGPMPLAPAPTGLLVLLLAAVIAVLERDRRLAWASAYLERRRRRLRQGPHRLPAFDALEDGDHRGEQQHEQTSGCRDDRHGSATGVDAAGHEHRVDVPDRPGETERHRDAPLDELDGHRQAERGTRDDEAEGP
jgi:autotransporter-associated beta strand protein